MVKSGNFFRMCGNKGDNPGETHGSTARPVNHHGTFGARFRKAAAYNNGVLHTPLPAFLHSIHHGRHRNNNNRQVNRIRNGCDCGLAAVAQQLTRRRVDRIDRSAVVVLHKVADNTITEFVRIRGCANNSHTARVEEWLKHGEPSLKLLEKSTLAGFAGEV